MDAEQYEQPRGRPRALVLVLAIVAVAVIGVIARTGFEDPGNPSGTIQTGLEGTPEPTAAAENPINGDPQGDPAQAPALETTLSAFEPANRWQPLPNAPIEATTPGPAVWDGRRMVLWPGSGYGGMYAVDVDAWAALPPAPVTRTAGWSATWSGEEVLYWGGLDESGQPTADGVRLNPAAGLWRQVAEAPLTPRHDHGAVWGGGRLWVFGGTGPDGEPLADGAAYDPETDTWALLPESPLPPRARPTVVWTDDGLLVWGGLDGREDARHSAGLTDGAFYRPGEGWQPIPDLPVPLRRTSAAVWTGDSCTATEACRRLLVWGRPAASLSERDGYSFDTLTGLWSRLPLLLSTTRSDGVGHWADDKAIVFGGRDQFDRRTRLDGFVYDPATENWRQIPAVPFDVGEQPAVVWTGSELIVWGNGQGARLAIAADLLYDGPRPWSRELPINTTTPADGS